MASEVERQHWDQKWAQRSGSDEVAPWLRRHQSLLRGGVAADIACGRGQNARWLARRGYAVLGVDFSREALEQAWQRATANERDRLLLIQADLTRWRLPAESVDLLIVFRFLDREILPSLCRAVRPGGLLIYETRHDGWLQQDPEATRDYLLRRGELPALFSAWEVIAARDGEYNAGIVARRPLFHVKQGRAD